MKRKTIRFIDYEKALLMITVVLCHINFANQAIKAWSTIFNMPAFFFASGMLIKKLPGRDPASVRLVLSKKTQSIVFPYFLWAMIYSSLTLSNLLHIFYGSHAALVKAGSLTSLWFLPTLFMAFMIFTLAQWILGDRLNAPVKLVLAVAAFAGASALPKLKEGWPWCVDLSFTAFGFLMLGNLLFRTIQRFREFIGASGKGKVIGILVLLLSFLGMFLYRYNIPEGGYILMAEARYGNYCLFLLLGGIGTVFVTTAACFLDIFLPESREGGFAPLSFIGQNTLCILTLHKLFISLFRKLFAVIPVGTTIALLGTCLGTLVICWPVTVFINRYIPILAGKAFVKDSKKQL